MSVKIWTSPIVYVAPERLAWGVISDAPEGDIRAAYSADVIMDGKIRTPFEHAGQRWVTGGMQGELTAWCYPLIPLNQWRGRVFSYNEMRRRIDCAYYGVKDKAPEKYRDVDAYIRGRFFYRGVSVKWKGAEYVMGEESVFAVRQPTVDVNGPEQLVMLLEDAAA